MSRGDARDRLIAAATEILAGGRHMSMPLRAVADRAGTTTGAIQHHFGNRDGLVLAVLQWHGERMVQRLQGLGTEQPPPPLRVARAILLQFLPLDDERREEALVAHAFEGLAAGDEDMQRAYRQQYRLLADMLAAHLPLADSAGVDLLLAAVGGLRTDILLDRIDTAQAGDLLDRLLESYAGEHP